jgi:hypothetical protein
LIEHTAVPPQPVPESLHTTNIPSGASPTTTTLCRLAADFCRETAVFPCRAPVINAAARQSCAIKRSLSTLVEAFTGTNTALAFSVAKMLTTSSTELGKKSKTRSPRPTPLATNAWASRLAIVSISA